MATAAAQVAAVKQAFRDEVERAPRDGAVSAYNARRNTDTTPAPTLSLLEDVIPLVGAATPGEVSIASYDAVVIACTPSPRPWGQLPSDTLATVAELATALRAHHLRCAAAAASPEEVSDLHRAIVAAPADDTTVFVEDALRRAYADEDVDALLRSARGIVVERARHFGNFAGPAELKAATGTTDGRPSTVAGLDLATYVAIGMATGTRVELLLPRPRALALPFTVRADDEDALLLDLAGLYPAGREPPSTARTVTFALLAGVLPMATQPMPPTPGHERAQAPAATQLVLTPPPSAASRQQSRAAFVQADVGAVYSAQSARSSPLPERSVAIAARLDPPVTRSATGKLPQPRRRDDDGNSSGDGGDEIEEDDDNDDDDDDDDDEDENDLDDREDYVDDGLSAMDVEGGAGARRRRTTGPRPRGLRGPARREKPNADPEYAVAKEAVYSPASDDEAEPPATGTADDEDEGDDAPDAEGSTGPEAAAAAGHAGSNQATPPPPQYAAPVHPTRGGTPYLSNLAAALSGSLWAHGARTAECATG